MILRKSLILPISPVRSVTSSAPRTYAAFLIVDGRVAQSSAPIARGFAQTATTSNIGPSYSNLHVTSQPQSSWKGKEKADPSVSYKSEWLFLNPSNRLPRHILRNQVNLSRQLSTRRAFHATARRDAIPLIPAALAIFKSGSALAIITTISRVLVSFLPLTAIASFRWGKGVRWMEGDAQIPKTSPEADEFFTMWCKGEKGKRFKRNESLTFSDWSTDEHEGLTAEDGRTAYPAKMPWGRHRYGSGGNPFTVESAKKRGDNTKEIANAIEHLYIILPPLPPASIKYYEELSPEQRAEVNALRRYWIQLQMFKNAYRINRWFVAVLIFLPFLLCIGVVVCGIERVPLTGRRRLILLTPEEEDAISTSLAGANWYQSVINLLTTPERPAPPVVSYDDWRWRWVQSVLRQLETAVIKEVEVLDPSSSNDKANTIPQLDYSDPSLLLPPPPSHPLRPRPRVSSLLHGALPGSDKQSGREHLEIGPPYSLMLLDKEDKNAFSYGFGGKGAGGIVVFTGLLDEILSHDPASLMMTENPQPKSFSFFGSIFASPTPPPTRRIPQPTEEQTLHLACVLAHEMGHLLLSHHLETLSQQQVFWPAILGLSTDLLRAFIWPITFFLGPTVNDALANVGKTSAEVVANEYGEIGFQWKHEYEADLAALRLLALAGFDPRKAVNHFANSVADLHEIQPGDKNSTGEDTSWSGRLMKLWTTTTHPAPEKRVLALRKELERWESARRGIDN